MTQIEYDNVHKYLKAPSLAEIDAFIKDLDITDAQFERYYEMVPQTIKNIRNGYRPLPRKFWHFVYEKIVPSYGVTYQNSKLKFSSKKSSVKSQRKGRINVNRLIDLG